MYNTESDRKGLEVSSRRSPTMIEVQIPDKPEEIHSALTTKRNPLERHSKVQEEEEYPLSYNIDEIFEAFTFNLFKKEVRKKRIRNKIKNDGTLK